MHSLDLYRTRVTDVGLAYLRALTSLEYLNLDDAKITDAGLPQLNGLTRLKKLRLAETGVTGGGVEALRRALPGATIEHSVREGSKAGEL